MSEWKIESLTTTTTVDWSDGLQQCRLTIEDGHLRVEVFEVAHKEDGATCDVSIPLPLLREFIGAPTSSNADKCLRCGTDLRMAGNLWVGPDEAVAPFCPRCGTAPTSSEGGSS